MYVGQNLDDDGYMGNWASKAFKKVTKVALAPVAVATKLLNVKTLKQTITNPLKTVRQVGAIAAGNYDVNKRINSALAMKKIAVPVAVAAAAAATVYSGGAALPGLTSLLSSEGAKTAAGLLVSRELQRRQKKAQQQAVDAQTKQIQDATAANYAAQAATSPTSFTAPTISPSSVMAGGGGGGAVTIPSGSADSFAPGMPGNQPAQQAADGSTVTPPADNKMLYIGGAIALGAILYMNRKGKK